MQALKQQQGAELNKISPDKITINGVKLRNTKSWAALKQAARDMMKKNPVPDALEYMQAFVGDAGSASNPQVAASSEESVAARSSGSATGNAAGNSAPAPVVEKAPDGKGPSRKRVAGNAAGKLAPAPLVEEAADDEEPSHKRRKTHEETTIAKPSSQKVVRTMTNFMQEQRQLMQDQMDNHAETHRQLMQDQMDKHAESVKADLEARAKTEQQINDRLRWLTENDLHDDLLQDETFLRFSAQHLAQTGTIDDYFDDETFRQELIDTFIESTCPETNKQLEEMAVDDLKKDDDIQRQAKNELVDESILLSGTHEREEGTYTGQYVNIRTGHGKCTYNDGSIFDGQWEGDCLHG